MNVDRERHRPGTMRSWLKLSARGASAVEFALILPVLLIFVLGIIDFGMAIFKKMELQSAVRSGAQFALSNATNTTSITTAVVEATNSGISSSDVTLTCQCLDSSTESLTSTTCGSTSCSSGEYVMMTISAASTYTPLIIPTVDTSDDSPTRFLGFIPSSFSLSGSVTIRVQ